MYSTSISLSVSVSFSISVSQFVALYLSFCVSDGGTDHVFGVPLEYAAAGNTVPPFCIEAFKYIRANGTVCCSL
jgi:hypothetical protein